jgi:hypothetical protein
MRQPPLLPEEVLARVLRLARMNGTGVLMISGFFALLSAMGGDYVAAIAGLVVAGCGALELHGGGLVAHGEKRGTNWLVNSQLLCLFSILAYCGVRLVNVQLPPVPEELKPLIEMDAQQFGMSPEEFLLKGYRALVLVVALVATFYQGGLAAYYGRRRAAVIKALDAFPVEGATF